jgi:hypothetical protein
MTAFLTKLIRPAAVALPIVWLGACGHSRKSPAWSGLPPEYESADAEEGVGDSSPSRARSVDPTGRDGPDAGKSSPSVVHWDASAEVGRGGSDRP